MPSSFSLLNPQSYRCTSIAHILGGTFQTTHMGVISCGGVVKAVLLLMTAVVGGGTTLTRTESRWLHSVMDWIIDTIREGV